MTIVVAYKWAPNPQDAVVGSGGIVDFSRAKATISEYDPVAFELARRLGDSTGAEVVGITVGDASIDTSLARKSALSRGLDRLLIVADDRLAGADGTRLAAVLAAVVRGVGDVDLVLAGESSVDVTEGQVAMTLAGQLGWLGLNAVSAVSASDGGYAIERDVPAGTASMVLTGPAVLAATADAVLPRVPGMKDILGAAKKPVEVLALDALDVPAARGSLTAVSASRPASGTRSSVIIDGTDPAAAATELVGALRAAKVL
jgi:electron transfer flavoprotein beta subunit